MKRAARIIPLVALAVLLATSFAFAETPARGVPRKGFRGPEGWERGPWEKQPWGFPRWEFARGMTLTDEQKAKILEIEKNYTTQIADLRARIRTKHLELRELQLKEASEEVTQDIRTKIGEILDLQSELATLRKNMMKEILTVLTPEQLKNFPPFRWESGRKGGFGPFCPGIR